MKYKGMPFHRSPTSRGHLVVTFEVEYPGREEIDDKDHARLSRLLGQSLSEKVTAKGEARQMEEYEEAKQPEEE